MYYAEDQIDKLIREKFFPDWNYKGTFLEVGAGPPEFYSTSKHFRDSGWRCIGFDPNPKFVEQHKKIGNEIYQIALADFVGKSNFTIVNSGWEAKNDGISYSALEIRYDCNINDRLEIQVDVDRLDNVLQRLQLAKIDVLVIDVEGWELDVLRGLNTALVTPRLIVLENYQYNDEYNRYMDSIGYFLVCSIKHNYFYIPTNWSKFQFAA